LVLAQSMSGVENRLPLVVKEGQQAFVLVLDQRCVYRHGSEYPSLKGTEPGQFSGETRLAPNGRLGQFDTLGRVDKSPVGIDSLTAFRKKMEVPVATFITIGYGDEAGYERTTTQAKHAAHVHDAWLVERGAIVGIVGSPIQVRNHQNRGTRTDKGAYLKSDLPIAGFSLIEASTREEAVELVAKTPCAVAYGVVEVWPLIVPSGNERLQGEPGGSG
jgi:hypothetical protein